MYAGVGGNPGPAGEVLFGDGDNDVIACHLISGVGCVIIRLLGSAFCSALLGSFVNEGAGSGS